MANHQNNFATNLTAGTTAGDTTSPINSIPSIAAPFYLAFDATNINGHYEVVYCTSKTATNVNHAAITYNHTTAEEVRMVVPAVELDTFSANITSVAALPTADGWKSVSDSWAYASASTITVPSGAASLYSKGDKIKLTQTTVKYFYVIGVADTVLTVTGGSDYTVANAAISAISVSHTENPVGFPAYFNTAAVTFSTTYLDNGSGGTISSSSSYFKIRENICEHIVVVGACLKVGTNVINLFVFPTTLPALSKIISGCGIYGTINVPFVIAADQYMFTANTVADNANIAQITMGYSYLF